MKPLDISNLRNPSSRSMVLALTQLLTEMSIRNRPCGRARTARKAENITDICELIEQKMWDLLYFSTPMGL
jgi:hypothetical protein